MDLADETDVTRLYALTGSVLLILLAGVGLGIWIGWHLCRRVWAARVRGMIDQGHAVADAVAADIRRGT